MGVKLAIDDFGTGYSSLSYLNRFPMDYLKIDRSFVDKLGTGAENESIVLGTIQLTHALNMRAIAEGVETAEQARILREMGCDMAQGFYFSKAVPAQDASSLLSRAFAAPDTIPDDRT